MIRSLRKRHLSIWVVLGILLPIGFVMAFLAISEFEPVDQQLQFSLEEAFPKVVGTGETDYIAVQIRQDPRTLLKQIEIEVKQPLAAASALVYLTKSADQKIENGQLLSKLGAKGNYRIELDSTLSAQNTYQLLFYDQIKAAIIDKIQLSL